MDGKSKGVLVDSNIIIYSAALEYEAVALWLKDKNIYISDISRIEVLGYSKLLLEDRDFFEKFFSKCVSFSIDENTVLGAISLKQQRKMSLGDAIIAATALIQELPLITANIQDFKHIKELKLVNPLEL